MMIGGSRAESLIGRHPNKKMGVMVPAEQSAWVNSHPPMWFRDSLLLFHDFPRQYRSNDGAYLYTEIDYSGRGNHGISPGANTTNGANPTVQSNGVMRFDGADYILGTPSSDLVDLSAMTIGAIVYPTTLSASPTRRRICDRSGGHYAFGLTNAGVSVWLGAWKESSEIAPTTGGFQHFSISWDGSTLYFAKNGEIYDSMSCSFSMPSNTGNLYIGVSKGTLLDYFFIGDIAYFYLIGKSQTAAEITRTHNYLSGLMEENSLSFAA